MTSRHSSAMAGSCQGPGDRDVWGRVF